MFGFPVPNQDPLDTPTCEGLDKRWKGRLKRSWNNCSTNNIITKDPEWKELSATQKQAKINTMCCEKVMQCSNPNEWLQNNNINVTCVGSSAPNQPHFGLTKQHSAKITHPMLFGVF